MLFLPVCVFSQNLKTYQGAFEDGNATYQYYENEYHERVFQGSFSYTAKGIQITGAFNNNLKNGVWKISNKPSAYSLEGLETVTAEYLNGRLNGHCTYINVEQATNKVLSKSEATFKSNVLVAAFSFMKNYKTGWPNYWKTNIEIKANLDSTGFLDGDYSAKWKHNNIPYEDIRKYRNGYLLSKLSRNVSTGEIKNYENGDLDFISTDIEGGLNFWFRKMEDPENNNSYNPIYSIIKGTNLDGFNFEKDRKSTWQEELQADQRLAAKKIQDSIQAITDSIKATDAHKNEEQANRERAFERSDFGTLRSVVKSEFEKWLIKGEYETTFDFEKRVKEQSETQFKNVLTENIKRTQQKLLNPKYAKLGHYDPETETCLLNWGSDESITIKVSKQLAQVFYDTFKGKEHDRSTEIYIYPQKFEIVNNTWKMSEAIIVLNNYWTLSNAGALRADKVYNADNRFYYDREYNNYTAMVKEMKQYQMKDFSSIQNSSAISHEVFYYEYKAQPLTNIQSLNFTYTDLKINLPKF